MNTVLIEVLFLSSVRRELHVLQRHLLSYEVLISSILLIEMLGHEEVKPTTKHESLECLDMKNLTKKSSISLARHS